MREHSPLGAAYRFLKDEVLFGTLLYRYGVERHRELQQQATRSQRHTYTCFYRSPGQLEALVGPVLAWLAPTQLNIHVFASSTGAEPYTIASVLARHAPALDFHITASDLHEEMVDLARTAIYPVRDVLRRAPPATFLADTFERYGDSYRVRSELRTRVRIQRADLLDPAVADQVDPADIVFAQNVFCHLSPAQTRLAFRHVTRCLRPRAALFIDGMDLDLREELTSARGLIPLDFKIREIHGEARGHIGDRWWNYYYGLEPYLRWHPNSARRYGTIFLTSAG
ncbi:MAG: CheR family methyltransferase [Kofleriaceae bacterium]|nr:CheR family methyltransferase [Kofleriaceae bacterium]